MPSGHQWVTRLPTPEQVIIRTSRQQSRWRRRAKVVDAFADTDEAHRLRHWRAIAASIAAPGGAVKFGDDEAGDPDGLVEGAHLRQRVLADIGVEHQQHLVRPGVVRPLITRRDLAISSIRCNWAGRRPAVSARTMSMPRAFVAPMASKITAAGSPLSWAITVTLLRSPQVTIVLRAAAAEGVAGGQQHRLAVRLKSTASFPIEVVLPAPLIPASMMMKGGGWTRPAAVRAVAAVRAAHRPAPAGCPPAYRACRVWRVPQLVSRCWVASMPMSLVSSRVSSSSSSSSSTLPRAKIDFSRPLNCARVRERPIFSRSRQDGAVGEVDGVVFGRFFQETKHVRGPGRRVLGGAGCRASVKIGARTPRLNHRNGSIQPKILSEAHMTMRRHVFVLLAG